MAGFIVDLPNMVILNGGTDSNDIDGFDDAESITIYSPATLSGTITLAASPDKPTDLGGSTPTFYIMQSGGADITLPASKALTLTDISFRKLRLHSTGAEGADRTFRVVKQVYVNP